MNAKFSSCTAIFILACAATAQAQNMPAQQTPMQQQQAQQPQQAPQQPSSAQQGGQQPEQQQRAGTRNCGDLQGNAKDICQAEVEGQRKISEAQAKLTQRDTPKNRLDLANTQAEARYNIEKAKCGDQVGDAKKACEKVAKATRDLSMAQAEQRSLAQGAHAGPTSAGGMGEQGAAGADTQPSQTFDNQTPAPNQQPETMQSQ